MKEGSHVPLDLKIQLVEMDKSTHDMQIFGIIPQDYEIYRKMNHIEFNHDAPSEMNFNMDALNYKQILKSKKRNSGNKKIIRSVEEQECKISWDDLVIRKDSNLYHLWSFLVSICCLSSCYIYMDSCSK